MRQSRSKERMRSSLDQRRGSIGSKEDDSVSTQINAMEHVKRIAQNINHRLAGGKVLGEDQVASVNDNATEGNVIFDTKGGADGKLEESGRPSNEQKVKDSEVIQVSSENVSLKAVGQYGDGEANENEKTSSLDKIEKAGDGNKTEKKRSRSCSRSPRRRQRSRSPQRRSPQRHRNRSRSREERTTRRAHNNSHNRSKERRLDNRQQRRPPYQSRRNSRRSDERNDRSTKAESRGKSLL